VAEVQLEHCFIRVSDIVEYPTELGNGCSLLQRKGLHPYGNTEEELLEVLTESAAMPSSLELCLESSRCRKFYDLYNEGHTPFSEKDPIRLLEYQGRYWASEGKHRVCMAKRLGVEKIDAHVYHSKKDIESLLPYEGEPGHFVFSYSFILGSRKPEDIKGTAGYLWADSPHGLTPGRFSFRGGWLNVSNDTEGELLELFPGLQYRVSVTIEKVGFWKRREKFSVEAEVVIRADHPKTKIWLLDVPAKELPGFLFTGELSLRTVYRFGCWRMKHLSQLLGNCLSMY